jgi:hypothetical protein
VARIVRGSQEVPAVAARALQRVILARNGAPLALALAGALLAGCGAARQDAHETKASYPVEVLQARFPSHQVIARPTTLTIAVRNPGASAIPNVAVSVDSFEYISNFPGLADRSRPVWAIERGPGLAAEPPVETQEVSLPGSATTAYVHTWALGRLAAGQTRTFAWRVVPVKPGAQTVHFLVAAGLAGKARARALAGGSLGGRFQVTIAGRPPLTYVDPSTGKVRIGSAPKSP